MNDQNGHGYRGQPPVIYSKIFFLLFYLNNQVTIIFPTFAVHGLNDFYKLS